MEVFRSLAWAMSHQGERLDEEGRWVAANCAGLAVLYRAGVLDGYEVTGPATVARRLAALGVDVASPRRSWMIDPSGTSSPSLARRASIRARWLEMVGRLSRGLAAH